ncbi:hypothetical protein K2W90_02910 [Candidatus Babeliales bacterium]|nr:hypothetical protein [Candidatus Babeliales bacterium]
MIKACPKCKAEGGQGAIYKAKILDLGIELNICDECEAFWTKDQIISKGNFKILTPFLEENKLTYDNAKIEDLGYLENETEA